MGITQLRPCNWKFSPTTDKASLRLLLMKLKYLKKPNGSNANNTPAIKIRLGHFVFSMSNAE